MRFCWEEETDDLSDEMVTTTITIWIGVNPDSLSSDVTFEPSNDILQLLEKHDIHDIDFAYCESECFC